MREDIDQLLNDSAPESCLHEEHRRQLKLLLLSRAQTRQKQIPVPLIGIFVLVLLALAPTFDIKLIGEDFKLIGTQRSENQQQEYESVTDMRIITQQDCLDPQQQQEGLERIIEREAASEERLHGVGGWTVGNETFFMVDYTYDVEGDQQLMARFATFPEQVLNRAQAEFLLNCKDKVLGEVTSGHADFIGTEDRIIDGSCVRFEKWVVESKECAEVVCWRGTVLR